MAQVVRSSAPPKWKMAVITWIGIYPTLAVFLNGTAEVMGGLHPLLRLFLNTLMIIPLMTWVILPGLMRLMHGWLFARDDVDDVQPQKKGQDS